MPLIGRFGRVFCLISFANPFPVIAHADNAVPLADVTTVKIKIAECSLIVVPVMINESGPFDFVLDTGASVMMVDRKLAANLALPSVGEKRILGIQRNEIGSTVHANSISIGGAEVVDLDLVVSDQVQNLPAKVRGVVGESFLRSFDVLIDYRHQVIQLEAGLGPLAQKLSGEHLPLQLNGILRGQPTARRLIVFGLITGFNDKPISLLLDSGTNNVVLFRKSPGASTLLQQTSLDPSTARPVSLLKIGGQNFSNVMVIALDKRGEMDSDGLVPTSLFDSVFISHEGRFVILNPLFRKVGH